MRSRILVMAVGAVVGLSATVLPPEVYAQPPERVRVDLALNVLGAPTPVAGFFGGAFPPPHPGDTEPVRVLTLGELSTTVNVSSRVSASVGLPFAVTLQRAGYRVVSPGAVRPQYRPTDPSVRLARGDLHTEVGVLAVAERRFLPAVSVAAELSAPTASLTFLGVGTTKAGGRLIATKTFHPRLSVFAGYGRAEFQRHASLSIAPAQTVGGGIAIGMTRATIVSLYVEESAGATHTRSHDRSMTSALNAGVAITRFSRGRPRFSFLVSGGGLRGRPILVSGFRWAIASR